MGAVYDEHKNFAYTTVATAPSPASSGTSLVVAAGTGTRFPTVPFNATVWPIGQMPLSSNAEIVRVTGITTDTFTITRSQEGTAARGILVGDQIAATITAKTLNDVESETVLLPGFRLSAMSGSAVPNSNVTATTMYYTPFLHNRISLYDGTRWVLGSSSEVSLALGTLTSGKNYDVFAYINAGSMALEFSAAWTNNTTRADALTTLNGRWVKDGTPTRLYVGSFRTTSTTETMDTVASRLVWNAYNRVRRTVAAFDSTNSWIYNTQAWRQMNDSTANQINVLCGLDALSLIKLDCYLQVASNVGNPALVGIGEDSVSAYDATAGLPGFAITPPGIGTLMHSALSKQVALGYHYYAALEYGTTSSEFYGDAGSPLLYQSGLSGFYES